MGRVILATAAPAEEAAAAAAAVVGQHRAGAAADRVERLRLLPHCLPARGAPLQPKSHRTLAMIASRLYPVDATTI